MQPLSAWYNGAWEPMDRIGIRLDDVGFLQGATIVDRLRTVQHQALHVGQHLARFQHSCESIGLMPPKHSLLVSLVQECVQRNSDCFADRDFAVVMLATPGPRHLAMSAATISGSSEFHGTCIVHPAPLPWSRMSACYQQGQPILLAETRNVPAACWSPLIKTRSRLHYYLADCQASQIGGQAAAVLLDLDGNLTETSTANFLLVEDGGLVCPPLDTVLNGVGLLETLRLASELGIKVSYEPVCPSRASQANEFLLCGGSGLIWPASELIAAKAGNCGSESRSDKLQIVALPAAENDALQGDFETLARFETPASGIVYRQLLSAWQRELKFDFVEQARNLGG
ncbi:MAG: aminotransferase class IV [bacterium]|nr:aminotransferase class IV [bacterium]